MAGPEVTAEWAEREADQERDKALARLLLGPADEAECGDRT